MSIESQNIDCNCNNYKHMVRDMDAFKKSSEFQKEMQLNYFETIKRKLVEKAKFYRDKKGDLEMWNDLLTDAEKMIFVFDKSYCAIQFGNCSKLNKLVSFIPNTCQLDTQQCFENRK